MIFYIDNRVVKVSITEKLKVLESALVSASSAWSAWSASAKKALSVLPVYLPEVPSQRLNSWCIH